MYKTYSNQITTIRYGQREYEEIDIVSPVESCKTGAGADSLLAYIHGGYWQEG